MNKPPKAADPPLCGVSLAMDVLGGKWKPCLIHGIRNGWRRPSELHRLNPTAPARVLNQQLKELEDSGLVRKVVYPVLPPRAEYFLTSQGESVLPIVDALETWGIAYSRELRPQATPDADSDQPAAS